MKRLLILCLVSVFATACSSPAGTSATVTIRGAVTGPKYFVDQQGAVIQMKLVPDLHGSLMTGATISVTDEEGRVASAAPTVALLERTGDVITIKGSDAYVVFQPPVADGTSVTLVVTAPEGAPAPWRCMVLPHVKSPNVR